MANEEHLRILKQGVRAWNHWRQINPHEIPDLSEAELREANLSEANLSETNFSKAYLSRAYLNKADLSDSNLKRADLYKANLTEADLNWADLRKANLDGADLERANLIRTNLRKAKLRGANLSDADLLSANLDKADLRVANLSKSRMYDANLIKAVLRGANFTRAILYKADLSKAYLLRANLSGANLNGANLRGSNLEGSQLVKSKLNEANLSGSRVFGISAWKLELKNTIQTNLIITPESEPNITVDNLEVAQFVYLLLNNEKIRNVIDTIGEKGVLILGRFTEQRKVVLNAIRDKLRELGFVPMMFDFEKPTQRDFTETIKTLAGLSRFIIADITNPKSSPLELQATMPDYMIPFVPIIQDDDEPFAMFQDLQQKYGDWVLDVLRYDSAENLLKVLDKAVVKPALKKADELLIKKAEGIRARHVKDYI